MKLINLIKQYHQEKLKHAIASNSKEAIEVSQQILRQYSTHDIHIKNTGHFTKEVLKNIRVTMLTQWKNRGFPLDSIITMFLYGSWMTGTHSDISNLNVYIIYKSFDKNNKTYNTHGYNINDKISLIDIKKRMKQDILYTTIDNKQIKLDIYFQEVNSKEIEEYHLGAKILL